MYLVPTCHPIPSPSLLLLYTEVFSASRGCGRHPLMLQLPSHSNSHFLSSSSFSPDENIRCKPKHTSWKPGSQAWHPPCGQMPKAPVAIELLRSSIHSFSAPPAQLWDEARAAENKDSSPQCSLGPDPSSQHSCHHCWRRPKLVTAGRWQGHSGWQGFVHIALGRKAPFWQLQMQKRRRPLSTGFSSQRQGQ